MTIAEINALLYSPNHARDRLQSALRIEALSPGWQSSFEALLEGQTTGAGIGNPGLAPAAAAHPVAPGFQPLAVAAQMAFLNIEAKEPGRSAASNGSARPIRGLASSADRRRPATLSQLLTLGSRLDRALSN